MPNSVTTSRYPDAPEKDHVRRLTPTEFEILMGLPIGWTEIGHDGKLISDCARYKSLGNSIVVGCAEYIIAGIAAALQGNPASHIPH